MRFLFFALAINPNAYRMSRKKNQPINFITLKCFDDMGTIIIYCKRYCFSPSTNFRTFCTPHILGGRENQSSSLIDGL